MPKKEGSKSYRFRAQMKAIWQPVNQACGICGQDDIDWDGAPYEPDSFELDHRLPRIKYPELEFEPSNAQPSHHRCNRNKGAGDQPAGIGLTSEEW